MNPIKHTLDLDASPAAAYRAVATPEGIKGWWCKDSDVSTDVGGDNELRFVKDGNPVTMKFRDDALDGRSAGQRLGRVRRAAAAVRNFGFCAAAVGVDVALDHQATVRL